MGSQHSEAVKVNELYLHKYEDKKTKEVFATRDHLQANIQYKEVQNKEIVNTASHVPSSKKQCVTETKATQTNLGIASNVSPSHGMMFCYFILTSMLRL